MLYTLNKKIAVLEGDGIGPEIINATFVVLKRVIQVYPNIKFDHEPYQKLNIQIEKFPVGGYAIDTCGSALPSQTLKGCEQADAILFGSIGGPKWEYLPPEKQPERAALLPLRKHFELFANLRPVRVYPQMEHQLPIKNTSGVNILIIRELTGGIYFAQPKQTNGRGKHAFALDTLKYHRFEIERIARLAFSIAKNHRQRHKVHSIDKANVLTSMVYWRKIVSDIFQNEYASQEPQVELSHLYVDNAAMQLIINPHQFDVLLCPNMFGDILSDEASALSGSLGLLPSASLSAFGKDSGEQFGLYEPAGGSAPDIAGKGIANPIAQILSLALLFRHSLNLESVATAIEQAVEKTLADGIRSQDLARSEEKAISCLEIAQEVCQRIGS